MLPSISQCSNGALPTFSSNHPQKHCDAAVIVLTTSQLTLVVKLDLDSHKRKLLIMKPLVPMVSGPQREESLQITFIN